MPRNLALPSRSPALQGGGVPEPGRTRTQRVLPTALVGMAVSVALAVSMNATAAAGPPLPLADRLQPLIDAHRGVVSVAVKHLGTGEFFGYRADQPMPTASLIKFPVLIELYRQSEAGKVDLQQLVTLRDEDKVPGSGILTYHFSNGAQFPLRDAARLMIVYSDNTATNLVVDRIGLPATRDAMRELGCPNTQLNAKVFRRDTSIAPERSQQFGLGSTTAAEMLSLFERLAAGELVGEKAREAMMEDLYACDDRTKIPRLLPAGTKVAHKTGAVTQSRTDAGLIDSPSGRIAICILTDENADRSWSDDNQANLFCSQLALAVYEHFNPAAAAESPGPAELAVGAQNELVEALQRTLNVRLSPSPELGVDGDFGPQTEAAVKRFQQTQGLEPDGRVDPATWAASGPWSKRIRKRLRRPRL